MSDTGTCPRSCPRGDGRVDDGFRLVLIGVHGRRCPVIDGRRLKAQSSGGGIRPALSYPCTPDPHRAGNRPRDARYLRQGKAKSPLSGDGSPPATHLSGCVYLAWLRAAEAERRIHSTDE